MNERVVNNFVLQGSEFACAVVDWVSSLLTMTQNQSKREMVFSCESKREMVFNCESKRVSSRDGI